MANTFVFRSGSVDPSPLQDGLIAILNQHPNPLACLDIRRVRLLPVSGQSATGAGVLSLQRISALSGGLDVAPNKHDTNSSSLPAEVLCRSMPDEIVSVSLYRKLGEVPVFSSTLANFCNARVQSSSFGSARTQNDDFIRFPTSADVEKIILREGEGLAIVEDTFSIPHAGAAGFCVRNTSSGACYTFRSRDVRKKGAAGLAHIAILNGTGSGVVIEVFNVQYPEEGEWGIPQCRLARIDGVEGGSDASSDIVAMDSEKLLPSSIRIIEGPFRAKLAGEDSGVPYDWHTRHGIDGFNIRRQFKAGTIRSLTLPVVSTDANSLLLYSPQNAIIFAATGGNQGIVLRPGEGLGLLSGRENTAETNTVNNSTLNCYQVEIAFNYVAPPVTNRTSVNLGV